MSRGNYIKASKHLGYRVVCGHNNSDFTKQTELQISLYDTYKYCAHLCPQKFCIHKIFCDMIHYVTVSIMCNRMLCTHNGLLLTQYKYSVWS